MSTSAIPSNHDDGTGIFADDVIMDGQLPIGNEEVRVRVLHEHADDAVKACKSSPVMAMAERVAAVEACKYADEVIPDAPIVIDEEFLTRHRIDMVFHGHTEAEDHLYRESTFDYCDRLSHSRHNGRCIKN